MTISENPKFCASCSAAISDTFRFCGACGTACGATAQPDAGPSVKPFDSGCDS